MKDIAYLFIFRWGLHWRIIDITSNLHYVSMDCFDSSWVCIDHWHVDVVCDLGAFGRRMYVTDSWILKTTTYYVYVAHQSDIHLTLEEAEEHPLSYENATAAQYLNITVGRVEPHLKDFQIRYRSLHISVCLGFCLLLCLVFLFFPPELPSFCILSNFFILVCVCVCVCVCMCVCVCVCV